MSPFLGIPLKQYFLAQEILYLLHFKKRRKSDDPDGCAAWGQTPQTANASQESNINVELK